MANNKKQNYDFFDEMFDQLSKDDSKIINTTIADFGRQVKNSVKESVNESVKKQGYDNFTEMVSHNVTSAMKNEKISKPYASRTSFTDSDDSRFTFFSEALKNIVYESKYRGYYREGHQKAVSIYVERANFCRENLSELEKTVRSEIIRTKNRLHKSDLFEVGYLDGLEYVSKALLKSKMYMMTRIKEDLQLLK